jgi:hypothetical protein
MIKGCHARSFGALMKWRLVLLLLAICARGLAQDKTLAGIVFDKDTRDRIASVRVLNVNSGVVVYNNLTGGFKIAAKPGDKLVFSRFDYHTDTVNIHGDTSLIIYMARLAIMLREVSIRDSASFNPDKRLARTKNEYSKIYGSSSYRDFLNTPTYGPAGLSIDALWNSFSREGRNAQKLQGQIENDYHQNVIDFRFNRSYVGKITGLREQRLTDFMARYRPGYYTTKTATEYEFVSMIRTNLRRFLRNPRTLALPVLKGKVNEE